MITRLLADTRFIFRGVRARPALFLLSALTVALVVGAGSAVFAVANVAFVRPLPFPDAGRLARIYLLPPGVRDLNQANPLHPLDFLRLRERLTVGEGPEGLQSRERGIGGEGDPESVPAASVSAGLFRLLGATPAHGRTFTADEDLAGAPVVVLSDALWRRRFGGRPEAVGQFLDVDRVRHQIIGVMRPDFEPAYLRSELWTPLGIHAGHLPLPNATYIVNVVRLASETTLAELEAEVHSILAAVAAESPQTLKDWTSGVQTLREAQYGPQQTPLLLLLGAVAALALIAAANLMNLTLTRVIGRRPEAALRRALGAGTADLVRAELLEALIIAVIGGAAGVLLAAVMLPALLALDTAVGLRSAPTGVGIDWRVAASTFALSLLVTVAAGVIPAVREAARHRSGAFADLGRRASPHPRQHRTRARLVVAQTALACLLLSAAFVLFGAYDRTARSDPGFSAAGVLTAQLRLSESVYAGAEARVGLLNGVLHAVRSTPGVTDAGTTMNLMLPGFAFVTLALTSDPPDPNEVARTVQFRRVSDGYFKTLRIPLQTGRDFDDRDVAGGPPVAVVSRQFVDQYLGGRPAIGHRIRRANGVLTIVGVVGDVQDVGFGQAAQPTLYLPYRQNSATLSPISLVVRTAGDPELAAGAIKRAVWSVDPSQPLSNVTTASAFLRASLGPQRFRTAVLALFAALGLLLSVIGIYGVTARSVVERTREVGVRLALGGGPGAVWRAIALRSFRPVVAGAAVGVLGALPLFGLLRSALPEINASGLTSSWPALALLLATGAIAAFLPAHRVTRADPVVALRD